MPGVSVVLSTGPAGISGCARPTASSGFLPRRSTRRGRLRKPGDPILNLVATRREGTRKLANRCRAAPFDPESPPPPPPWARCEPPAAGSGRRPRDQARIRFLTEMAFRLQGSEKEADWTVRRRDKEGPWKGTGSILHKPSFGRAFVSLLARRMIVSGACASCRSYLRAEDAHSDADRPTIARRLPRDRPPPPPPPPPPGSAALVKDCKQRGLLDETCDFLGGGEFGERDGRNQPGLEPQSGATRPIDPSGLHDSGLAGGLQQAGVKPTSSV